MLLNHAHHGVTLVGCWLLLLLLHIYWPVVVRDHDPDHGSGLDSGVGVAGRYVGWFLQLPGMLNTPHPPVFVDLTRQNKSKLGLL
jgi:hypothetical protein